MSDQTGASPSYWASDVQTETRRLQTSPDGLSSSEAQQRLVTFGSNTLSPKKKGGDLLLFLGQFKSPIMLLLLGAAGLSAATGDPTDAAIITAIVLASNLLSFIQERGASGAVEKLLSLIEAKSKVVRDGQTVSIPSVDIVPGDIVLLGAGDVAPADGLLIELNQLSMNEAAMTGESFPAEKKLGAVAADAEPAQRLNTVFAGTFVASGSGKYLVCTTGAKTGLGQISQSLGTRPPEGDFERGVRVFGLLLMEVTMLLTLSIFAINVYLHRPVLESFMFALALAVGLTPQLLPAIISINLAKGAKRMADKKVIVKRLAAIENFGSMNVFCSDKTGTLTEGQVKLYACRDIEGQDSDQVRKLAFLNSKFQTTYENPIDQAILEQQVDPGQAKCVAELPYDFQRKRLTVCVEIDGLKTLISKGEVRSLLDICATANGQPMAAQRPKLEDLLSQAGRDGYRAIGVATKPISAETISLADEQDLDFVGFVLFHDPLKQNVSQDISNLVKLGVGFKVITGDNRFVAETVGKAAGIRNPTPLAGDRIRAMSDAELSKLVKETDIFAEVDPDQKRRIVQAIKKAGCVVGYLGDGINDAPALHVADVGISVSNAVDVAREAADLVLLEKDLGVLRDGVIEGRTTFANTLKYVFMATSANFGNMFSMAGASLFLPFLPLLPKQILLGNMLTDFPEMSISTDSVDEEMVDQPEVWDIHFIKKFMVVFGLANSACDYLTFAILLLAMHATPVQFRTGWFIENIVTAALIVLVIRTRKPFWKSRPSTPLIWMTLFVVAVSLLLPYTPLAGPLGLQPLSAWFILGLFGIMVFYVVVSEVCKHFFYRHAGRGFRRPFLHVR